MNQEQKEMIIKSVMEKDGLTREQANEYVMERWYHGCSHQEGLRRARMSPWAK